MFRDPEWLLSASRRSQVQYTGDNLIAEPLVSLTHAITIDRPARDVWPWLTQMGAGSRAGWYSYDVLDNGRQPSEERIVPELQHLARGMVFPALPGVTDGFTLLAFEPERYLILGWRPNDTLVMTWAFVLNEMTSSSCRLVVRAREGARLSLPRIATVADHGDRGPGRPLHHAAETAAWHQAPRRVDAGGHARAGRSLADGRQGCCMTGNSEGRRVATGEESWLRSHHTR